jgi:hypothetical protein
VVLDHEVDDAADVAALDDERRGIGARRGIAQRGMRTLGDRMEKGKLAREVID